MSTFTEHYNLDKYEDMDRPNLRDQYNAAMDKIDAALYDQGGDIDSQTAVITALQGTVAGHTAQINNNSTSITQLQTDVQTAQTTANNASTIATSAQADATQALAQLSGAHFYHIQNDERNDKWSAGAWASQACSFNGLVVFDDNTNHGILFGSFYAESTSTTAVTPWQQLGLVSLSDWVVDSQEGHDDYCQVNVINADWGAGLSISRMTGNLIYWTPVIGISNTLPAGEAVTAQVMFPVRRRSV